MGRDTRTMADGPPRGSDGPPAAQPRRLLAILSAMAAPVIRPRRDEDLPGCVQALRGVHEKDGYPVHWPADPRHWLTPDRMLGAWIAADAETVLGHVLLTQPSDAFADGISLPATKLALVGRLYVAVDARRGGLAADLLDRAARAAVEEARQAVLEVDANAPGPIALYERAGWRFVRKDTGGWIAADGLPARVRIYLAPEG